MRKISEIILRRFASVLYGIDRADLPLSSAPFPWPLRPSQISIEAYYECDDDVAEPLPPYIADRWLRDLGLNSFRNMDHCHSIAMGIGIQMFDLRDEYGETKGIPDGREGEDAERELLLWAIAGDDGALIRMARQMALRISPKYRVPDPYARSYPAFVVAVDADRAAHAIIDAAEVSEDVLRAAIVAVSTGEFDSEKKAVKFNEAAAAFAKREAEENRKFKIRNLHREIANHRLVLAKYKGDEAAYRANGHRIDDMIAHIENTIAECEKQIAVLSQ